jgi:hypothetical protein
MNKIKTKAWRQVAWMAVLALTAVSASARHHGHSHGNQPMNVSGEFED